MQQDGRLRGVGGRAACFAVASAWKVDPLACVCAFLAPGAVARAELSMGKDARRCSPRTLSTLVEQRAALVLRAFTAPSERVSD